MQNCIVLFCGLPGSGKTALIKEVSKKEMSDCTYLSSRQAHDLTKCEIHVISYDQLLPIKLQEKLVELEEWKTNRQQILRASEAYICYVCQIPETDSVAKCLQAIERSHLENIMICNKSTEGPVHPVNRCFLVEDNFYYRSMRYEWFQLARKYGLGFCQIYLDCTTQTAIQRNDMRREQVPEFVIQRMSERAEKPNKDSSHWEKHSILIDTESDFCKDTGIIFTLIGEALLHPVQQLYDKCKEKEQSQHICSQNILHQVDQILRKLVARKMKAIKDEANQDLKQLSKEFNSIREMILKRLRNGEINLPKSLMGTLQNSSLPGCQNQELLNFITEYFEFAIENG